MAVTITKITGIGGNPPTQIRVEGTVSGCEVVQVVSSCTTSPVQISIQTGGNHQWSVDLPNDKGCSCGTSVKVTAWCGLGAPSSDSVTVGLPLICDACPNVSVTADPPGACVNGKRSVTFRASINGVPATGAVLQWSFPNGVPISPTATTAFVVTTNGPLPSQTVEYSANISGPITQTASLQTILPANCPPVSVAVTIDPCPSCCPSMTLFQPTVTGCAPGSAVASFAAVLTSPTPKGCTQMTPSSYAWTLTGPSGQKYQRRTSQPNTDTSTPWTDVTNGSMARVQFASGGNYSISVTAVIPGIAMLCDPTDTQAFSITDCCPQLIGPLNASQKPGDPCTWIFSAQVSNPNNAAVNFDWSFHDGTTATTTLPQIEHTYTPSSINTGTTTVTLKSPQCSLQSLTTGVIHTCTPCPPGQHRDSNGNCVPDTPPCPPGQHRDAIGNCVPDTPQNGDSFNFCAGLLVAAIALLIIGGVGVILGICLSVMWLWIAGAIAGGVGLLLFIAWVVFCSISTPCSVMRTVHCILFWIIALFAPIIVALAIIFGTLPCFLAAAGAWGGWGTLYAWLGFVMRKVGCAPTC